MIETRSACECHTWTAARARLVRLWDILAHHTGTLEGLNLTVDAKRKRLVASDPLLAAKSAER